MAFLNQKLMTVHCTLCKRAGVLVAFFVVLSDRKPM